MSEQNNQILSLFQISYLELLLSSKVLRFGDFQTKSGRKSPYFFNTGHLDSGERMASAANFYAEGIEQSFGRDVDNLYGPAYKGIPLCVAISDKLALRYGRDVSFTFNRKEAKDHGEGGQFVGRAYQGDEKIIIVEDVLTGGTSLRETMELLAKTSIKVSGAFIGIDREEKGLGSLSARTEIEQQFGIKIHSLLSLSDLISYLQTNIVLGQKWIDDETMAKIEQYRNLYGAV
jgi:orotate phosphoribosyltransferase